MAKKKELLNDIALLMEEVFEAHAKLQGYESSGYSSALKKANEKIARLQSANIRAGAALVAAFEYIDGLAGEGEMRAALNAYRLGESPNEVTK